MKKLSRPANKISPMTKSNLKFFYQIKVVQISISPTIITIWLAILVPGKGYLDVNNMRIGIIEYIKDIV